MAWDDEPFSKYTFMPEAIRGYRDGKWYAIFALALEECTECGSKMVQRLPPWSYYQLFPKGLSFERQLKRVGWRFSAKESTLCEPCYDLRRGLLCAICGMRRDKAEIEFTLGVATGFQDHACRSCRETLPAILWEMKINEIKARHARDAAREYEDSTDETEEPDTDLGGSSG